MTEKIASVKVVGDVCIDWFAVPTTAKGSDNSNRFPRSNWELHDGLRMYAKPGGAWLLADLIARKAELHVTGMSGNEALHEKGCEYALHSLVELGQCQRVLSEAGRNDEKDLVWRITNMRGFHGRSTERGAACEASVSPSFPEAQVVVIDDVGNGFRHRSDFGFTGADGPAPPPWVVWKLSRPFISSELSKEILAKHDQRTIAIVSAEDLRAEGAAIARHGSWERCFGDVLRSVERDPQFKVLREVRHLIVRVGLEAALLLERNVGRDDRDPAPAPAVPRITLFVLPTSAEGAIAKRHPGAMLGCASVFTAAIVQRIAVTDSTSHEDAMLQGIRDGLQLAIHLHRGGLRDLVEEASNTGEAKFNVLDAVSGKFEPERVAQYEVPPLFGQYDGSRLIDYAHRSTLEQLATDVLRKGIPATVADVPRARYGKFETLDRAEIETYASISGLIGSYLQDPAQDRPLSIAVFGPPGSGKSFGVEQVALSLGKVEKVEFNLAQFTDEQQLIGAFHLVRDVVVRGQVPLVFFDEFDSNGLTWLRHFLAPMQDGKFKDGSSVHLIGKAIFIFAGGTAWTFNDFMTGGTKGEEPVRSDHKESATATATLDLRALKVPDFVSRLRGTINISGTDRRHPNDSMALVRRAVILRSQLKKKAPHLFDATDGLHIQEGVVRAFMNCPRFHHGARSMEAIIDMCGLAGRAIFDRASLPSREQLMVHVDPEQFLAFNDHQPEFDNLVIERIAIDIHERYRKANGGSTWADLKENHREENRRQARDIPRKLFLIGCDHRFGPPEPNDLKGFDESDILTLAEIEHERWCESRRQVGYVYDTKRSDAPPLTHPDLKTWADLHLDERKKDVDTVKAIPEMMLAEGFRIIRAKR